MKFLVMPGDGIGPEVMKQVQTIIDWMDKRRHVSFDVTNDVVGGAAIDKYGQPLGDNTLADAMGVDAVLLGAVGGPKWDNVERDLRPEMGLLTLRKEMDLYANLRPATVLPAMAKASSLKEELVSGLDMLIVRELTGGVYFGKPRGIEKLADDPLPVTLAVSLHQADDASRSAIMPVNKRYDLETLLQSINNYQRKTKRRVTFEWAAIQGENDDEQAARQPAWSPKGPAEQPQQLNVGVWRQRIEALATHD